MSRFVKLSDTFDKVIDYRGKTPKKLGGDWSENGYRALSALNIKTTGLVELDSVKYLDENLYKRWMKEEIEKGDILLTSEAPAGQVLVWDSDEKIVLSQRLFALRINKYFNNYFVKYFIQSDLGQKEILKNTTGSTVFGISAKMFDLISVPNIDINIQNRIASSLKSLDDKIELNNRMNAELEAMAKTLYDYWFVQFDFPDVNGKPYKSSGGKMVYNEELKREIPQGWEVNNILKIANLLGGGTPDTKNNGYWNGEIPFFTPSDACNSVYSLSTIQNITPEGLNGSSTKLFDKGTIFLTARGTVGNIMIASQKMAMNQSCYALESKTKEHIFLYLTAIGMVGYLKAKSGGSVFNSIVSNDIKNTPVIIPFLKLIDEFEYKFAPLFERILKNQQENQHLASLRDWLLPMLMNGQVRFKETYQEQTQTVRVAAEAKVEYKPTVKNDNFYKIQNVYAVLYANKLINVQQGEMALAKDMYLVDRIAQVNTGFAYAQHNWGSFDPAFKKTINNTQYFTKCNFPNSKAYYCDTADNGYLLAKIPSELKEKANATITELHNKIFKNYFGSKKAEMKELYATVLKCIEDTKSTDFAIIRQAMKNWKTPKQNFPDKASKFSEQQTKEAFSVIIKEGWDRKVLNIIQG